MRIPRKKPLTWDNLPELPDGWHWAVKDTCTGEIDEFGTDNNSVGGWVAGKPFDAPRFDEWNRWRTGDFVDIMLNCDLTFKRIPFIDDERFAIGELVAIANGFKKDEHGDWH